MGGWAVGLFDADAVAMGRVGAVWNFLARIGTDLRAERGVRSWGGVTGSCGRGGGADVARTEWAPSFALRAMLGAVREDVKVAMAGLASTIRPQGEQREAHPGSSPFGYDRTSNPAYVFQFHAEQDDGFHPLTTIATTPRIRAASRSVFSTPEPRFRSSVSRCSLSPHFDLAMALVDDHFNC